MILYKSKASHIYGPGQLLVRHELFANEIDVIASCILRHLPIVFNSLDDIIDLINNKENYPVKSINQYTLKVTKQGVHTFSLMLLDKNEKTFFHFIHGNLNTDQRLWKKFNYIP